MPPKMDAETMNRRARVAEDKAVRAAVAAKDARWKWAATLSGLVRDIYRARAGLLSAASVDAVNAAELRTMALRLEAIMDSHITTRNPAPNADPGDEAGA